MASRMTAKQIIKARETEMHQTIARLTQGRLIEITKIGAFTAAVRKQLDSGADMESAISSQIELYYLMAGSYYTT